MDHSMLNSFVVGCIALLVVAVGFLSKNWMRDVQRSNEKLANAIERLTNLITDIERNQDRHEFKIDKLEKDFEILRVQHALGRRSADMCRHPQCPIDDGVHPV